MTQVKDELNKVIQDEIPKIYPELISEDKLIIKEEVIKMIDIKLEKEINKGKIR